LAAALWLGVAPLARSAGGVVLLALTAAAVFVLAFCPTELLAPGEAPHTARGAVHAIAAFGGFATFVAAAALVTRGLRADERFGVITPALVALAWLSAIAFLALLAVVGAKAPIAGLVEKCFLAAREAWLFVVAGALLFLGRRAARGAG
jgi:uncharacterized membrane protein YhaH (DUF805 family)